MHTSNRRRKWVSLLAGGSLALSGLGVGGVSFAAPERSSPGQQDKVEDQLMQELQDEDRAEFWVRFTERPDMTQFQDIQDWNERGQAVHDALVAAAERSQQDIRAQLSAEGVHYESFWATNSIRVSGGDTALVNKLSAASEVEGIYATVQVEAPEPEPAEQEMAPGAVTWGVADVNAPDVWDAGFTGEDIVVASIDTGVQWDHPALINQYRGYDADSDTADHNYSWFDHAGTRPAPVDTNGHGTHVTGTMVGDDGGDNQVGVAPGAKWIAANGCCPSDAALIASGEWMIAPTDLNGENPDVSMRPHIINNSWGTTAPSNAPFMEDIFEAWNASGQFGVFANGNSGPGCETSGSPGSRIINYSVGNYTSSHTIAASSSRGAGQDGEIKPNISAPGSAIRSSVPGNGYANYTGTSMASPHVAGVVALVWSASEGLRGDYEGTRLLLDGTAIDTENLQCGGTAEKNNVFGEGRLDAYAAFNQAPVGPTGTIEGVVTDAETNEPIDRASVVLDGESQRSLTTNSAGEYTARVGVGEYTVSAAAFGYLTATVNASVEEDEVTTANLQLAPAPSGTVTGTVTDGSGYGFPLYARVAVVGASVDTYTDPETGTYSMELPVGSSYELRVEAQYPGYQTTTVEVNVEEDLTQDVAVPVDAVACNAPGYHIQTDGLWETFDEEALPEGWEIIDHLDNGHVWRFDDHGNRGNLTGGEGGFAIANSDAYGSGTQTHTTLVTPSLDMSGDETPAVGFNMDYNHLGTSSATVRLSLDGGETWEDVQQWTSSARGPREELVPLPDAAGESDVQIGFTYHAPGWHWWWQLDNVFVGERACVPAGEGGYVVGTVLNAQSGEGLVGATVTNLDHPEQRGTTTATPSDDNLTDGFYWIFSDTPGSHPFEAAARQHSSESQDVTVLHGEAVRADFELGSGFVLIDPQEINHTVGLGQSASSDVVFSNTGDGEAQVELFEVAGGFEIARIDRTSDRESQGAPVVNHEVETSFAAGGEPGRSFDAAALEPNDTWAPMPNLPRVAMDNRVVNLDGDYYSITGTTGSAAFADVYKFEAETQAWSAVAPLPINASAVNAAVVDGQIVVSGGWVDGGTSARTYVYDPGADSWTQVADAPRSLSASGVSTVGGTMYVVGGCTTGDCTPMSNGAMAYDLASDSWETLTNYPVSTAFPACGSADGALLCSGGNPGTGGIAASYFYDAGADSWSAAPDAPANHWAANYASANGLVVVSGGVQSDVVTNNTFAFDATAGTWVTDVPNPSAAVYRGGMSCGLGKVGGSSGGFTPVATAEQLPGWDCPAESGADVPWLTLDPTAFSVPSGGSVTVTVTTDSSQVDQPGIYTAGIRVVTDTPQSLDNIPVTMNVTAPRNWGILRGTVSGRSCEGEVSPIHGAMVDVTPGRAGQPDPVLWTDANGDYAVWLPSVQGGRYTLITVADGFRPQTRDTRINNARGAVEDFTLQRISC